MASARKSLDLERRALQEQRKGVVAPTTKGTYVATGPWTDAVLEDLLTKIFVPTFTPEEEYWIMTRFYEFYLTGRIRSGDNDHATIVDAIFLLKENGAPAIRNKAANGTAPYYVPNTSQKDINLVGIKSFEAFDTPELMKNTDELDDYLKLMGTYSDKTQSEFTEFITESLTTFKEQNPDDFIKNRRLTQLTAILAMVSLRSLTKEKVAVRNAYGKTQFRINLSSLLGISSSQPFQPPCVAFVNTIFSSLSGGSSIARHTVALLVGLHIEDKGPVRHPYIPGVLSASCLMHLSRTGLGMVQLLSQACEANDCTWETIQNYSYISHTRAAWQKLLEFLSVNETDDDTRVKSWPWSRVIADSYNHGLAPRENRPLACILAALAEPVTGKGIWTAKWIQGFLPQYEAFKDHGEAIRQILMVSPETILNELPEDVSAEIQNAKKILAQKASKSKRLEKLSKAKKSKVDLTDEDSEGETEVEEPEQPHDDSAGSSDDDSNLLG
ncbi:hypothetical protein [Primus virus]|uniref:Nucleoprotein n=1 Tax=Primus virus TaxID=2722918 RepID=A0A6H0CA79_9RHAB|nr:hypothetical protein [Primus virus]